MKRTYTVAGQFPVLDHKPGESFSADIPPEQAALLLESGALALGEGEDETVKVPCPACVEQGLKRPPKFDDLGELQKHYEQKHGGLVPPEALPDPEAEKEE